MKEWGWNGARWWKCDFHTHTPASNDYGKGLESDGTSETIPQGMAARLYACRR